jgi:hypothetical protein
MSKRIVGTFKKLNKVIGARLLNRRELVGRREERKSWDTYIRRDTQKMSKRIVGTFEKLNKVIGGKRRIEGSRTDTMHWRDNARNIPNIDY